MEQFPNIYMKTTLNEDQKCMARQEWGHVSFAFGCSKNFLKKTLPFYPAKNINKP